VAASATAVAATANAYRVAGDRRLPGRWVTPAVRVGRCRARLSIAWQPADR
jgi:hypothetical protein